MKSMNKYMAGLLICALLMQPVNSFAWTRKQADNLLPTIKSAKIHMSEEDGQFIQGMQKDSTLLYFVKSAFKQLIENGTTLDTFLRQEKENLFWSKWSAELMPSTMFKIKDGTLLVFLKTGHFIRVLSTESGEAEETFEGQKPIWTDALTSSSEDENKYITQIFAPVDRVEDNEDPQPMIQTGPQLSYEALDIDTNLSGVTIGLNKNSEGARGMKLVAGTSQWKERNDLGEELGRVYQPSKQAKGMASFINEALKFLNQIDPKSNLNIILSEKTRRLTSGNVIKIEFANNLPANSACCGYNIAYTKLYAKLYRQHGYREGYKKFQEVDLSPNEKATSKIIFNKKFVEFLYKQYSEEDDFFDQQAILFLLSERIFHELGHSKGESESIDHDVRFHRYWRGQPGDTFERINEFTNSETGEEVKFGEEFDSNKYFKTIHRIARNPGEKEDAKREYFEDVNEKVSLQADNDITAEERKELRQLIGQNNVREILGVDERQKDLYPISEDGVGIKTFDQILQELCLFSEESPFVNSENRGKRSLETKKTEWMESRSHEASKFKKREDLGNPRTRYEYTLAIIKKIARERNNNDLLAACEAREIKIEEGKTKRAEECKKNGHIYGIREKINDIWGVLAQAYVAKSPQNYEIHHGEGLLFGNEFYKGMTLLTIPIFPANEDGSINWDLFEEKKDYKVLDQAGFVEPGYKGHAPQIPLTTKRTFTEEYYAAKKISLYEYVVRQRAQKSREDEGNDQKRKLEEDLDELKIIEETMITDATVKNVTHIIFDSDMIPFGQMNQVEADGQLPLFMGDEVKREKIHFMSKKEIERFLKDTNNGCTKENTTLFMRDENIEFIGPVEVNLLVAQKSHATEFVNIALLARMGRSVINKDWDSFRKIYKVLTKEDLTEEALLNMAIGKFPVLVLPEITNLPINDMKQMSDTIVAMLVSA